MKNSFHEEKEEELCSQPPFLLASNRVFAAFLSEDHQSEVVVAAASGQEMGPNNNITITNQQNINNNHEDFPALTNGGEENPTQCHSWIRRRLQNLNPVRMVLAEMLGTFILMFSVCGIVATTQMTGGGEVGLLEYALTAGLSIIVIIFSVGPISGAHVNPSITLAFALLGDFPWIRVPFYIVAQIVGSIFAAFVGKSVYGIQAHQVTTRPQLHGKKKAFLVEFFTTFIVMFLSASMSRKAHKVGQVSGLVIGVAISLAVLISGPISGGSLNPARSIGPAIVAWRFEHLWLYIVAPTAGAVVAALLFQLLKIRCTGVTHPLLPPKQSQKDSAIIDRQVI
ncbi:hypothetical protein MKW98_024574 [Papaver atlanticum]|uniref:Aquaporin NIP7-1 n=1 Tax=Papaver atlanticum TaxID=357466 RepID=A0AAD4S8Q7_9MAGN|nr:hypothetical protein MKW98_024574 [Papaver atlanticum]